MKSDRPYSPGDLGILKLLRAPLENDDFHALYLEERDVWRRMHPNGDMKQETLHRIVGEFERRTKKSRKKAEVAA